MVKKLRQELRYDKGSIEISESGDGFLRARVVIARPGVFPYLTKSGDICYEAKLPEDLFSEITINSAKGVPVLDGHPAPDDNGGMVDTTNWEKHVKGALGDTITIENQMLEATETIFDAGLISELKSGKKLEVSIGFKTAIDETPGEFEGEKYDVRQTNIIINHIAHVEDGRAGEDVRAYLDSADGLYAVQIEKKKNKIKTRRDSKMSLEELLKKFLEFLGVKSDSGTDDDDKKKDNDPDDDDDKKKDSDPDDDDDSKKDNDPDDDDDDVKKTDSKDVKKLKKRLREAKARADAAEALAKKLSGDKKRQDAASELDKAVEKRLSLISAASSVIQDFKHDGLSDRDIMLKVIENALPFEAEFKTDKLDDVYIKARFDAAMTLVKERANITVGAGSGTRIDAAVIEEKKQKRLTVMGGKKK